MLISLGSLPPYSHALDRLVESLEPKGLDVTPIRAEQCLAVQNLG